MDCERALAVATAAAREAGDLLRADFHRPDGPRGHGDKADADTEAEHLIRTRLRAAFPDWGYLGEETGRERGQPGQPVWLVDPNDGTRDYLLGRRGSAVSIGLAYEGRPVLGVVFAFASPDDRGDLFTWAEGCGPLRRNEAPVAVTREAQLTAMDVVLLSNGATRRPEPNLQAIAPARFRGLSSIAHRLALVAVGEAAAMVSVYSPREWDYAGAHALLRGSGGSLRDESGEEVAYAPDGSGQVQRAFAGHSEVAFELSRRSWRGVRNAAAMAADWPVRLQRGRLIADAALLDRAQGCLLGQVAGDSLGALVEFERAVAIAAAHGDGPRELADGGTWNLVAGQPTDDSELALTLARTILRQGGYVPAAAAAAYRAWLDSSPFDVGSTTRAGLSGHPNYASEANGSLMRASPLILLTRGLDDRVVGELGRSDSALTHPNPVCGDAVAAFLVAGGALLRGASPADAHARALDWCRLADAQPKVLQALARAGREAPVCDAASQGWVLIALQNAFYELLHAKSLEAGVVASVRRGGDTDTNAAIAGALLGVAHGRSAIPQQWRAMVLSCHSHPACSRHPRPPEYWPADVLELAERLLLL